MPGLAHIGVGLASKHIAPKIPLWILLIGCMFLDILSFIFLPALWPTHGLVLAGIWTIVSMVGTAALTHFHNSRMSEDSSLSVIHTSLVFGFLVFSHWILDFIGWPMTIGDPNSTATGVPILFSDSLTIGLGVYSTLLGAIVMDLGVFIVGLTIYLHNRRKMIERDN
ncbi:MAG: hypothetical protein ACW98Y_11285 [Candidatus Thorarchaeota archaeon]|jgi:hypothetical protein